MNCNDNHIDVKKHINSMLRVSGVLVGLPIVAVTGHEDNAINCEKTQHLNFEQLLALSIGTDTCGKPALRVKYIESCTYKKVCANNDWDENFRSLFAYDSTLKTYALVLSTSNA